jgi:hypothetical protein
MSRWLLALGVLSLGFGISCAGHRPLILESSPSEQSVGEPGWVLSGGARDLYAVRRDTQGSRSAWLLEPVKDTYGKYGTWMRSIDAGQYRAKRVRITATIKTAGATRRVDFWARAQAWDSPGDGPGLGGDWQKLPADSDWKEDSIVMDVPAETALLQYGVGVAGPGKVWLESTKVEVVGQDVPITQGRAKGSVSWQSNVHGWFMSGDDPNEYTIGVDSAVHRTGHASGSLRCNVAQPRGFGTLMQSFDEESYHGKRVKLSAYIKSDKVAGWAGMWMRVDGPGGKRGMTAFDNMENRPIRATTDWTRYEIVLDVASDTVDIAYGVLLHGSGQVWIDDIAFDVVGSDVPTTDQPKLRKGGPENLDFEQ